jgi:hypothetical protein
MALWACTDASFLSRPKSGSVAGCSVGLGDPHPTCLTHPQKVTDKVGKTNSPLSVPPAFYNPTPLMTNVTHAPLHAFCQRIPVMVASVAEAEYAAAFDGGQVLVELTLTLTNLGHPQQSHPLLFVDNECAIGLATSSVRPKKSKSIDMRLDWIKERTGQNFSVLSSFLVSSTQPTSSPKSCLSTATSQPYLSFTAPPTILNPHTLFASPPSPSHTFPTTVPVVATGTHLP